MTKPALDTYGGNLLDLGYEGQLTHEYGLTDIDHKINESATSIDFGRVVARGATDRSCKPFAADADKILGLSVRSIVMAYNAAGAVVYKQYDSVPVMKTGYLFVKAAENVTQGDAALAITAQTGLLGGTTGGAAGAGRVAVPGCVWETTTVSGAIGKVRINN